MYAYTQGQEIRSQSIATRNTVPERVEREADISVAGQVQTGTTTMNRNEPHILIVPRESWDRKNLCLALPW